MPIQTQFSDLVHLLETHYTRYSWAPLTRPRTFKEYQTWLAKNYHGQMEFMATHAPAKENPQQLGKDLKTGLCLTLSYLPHPKPMSLPLKQARIALYAQGEDYHGFFLQKLKDTCEQLQKLFPDEVFLPFTDSGPILERELAHRAGLGWVGKNTCLINRQDGSLFLLGEILTSLEMPNSQQEYLDFCGKCQKCMEACPTQAIEKNHVLNATKCISYWTIESKDPAPVHLRSQIGDWLFGCDICQTVCPWNQKAFGKSLNVAQLTQLNSENRQKLIEDLRWILTTSNKQIDKLLLGSPLLRSGGRGLKKNALIVVANQRLSELTPEVVKIGEIEKYQELAQWALQQLNPKVF